MGDRSSRLAYQASARTETRLSAVISPRSCWRELIQHGLSVFGGVLGLLGAPMLLFGFIARVRTVKDAYGKFRSDAPKWPMKVAGVGTALVVPALLIAFGISDYNEHKNDPEPGHYGNPYQEPVDDYGGCPAGPYSC
jgi:hypothetical protein